MSELDNIASAADSGEEYARLYIEYLNRLLGDLDFSAVGKVMNLFLETRRRGNKIFFLGNGGSAATASHFANDMSVCASPEDRKPFRALSLTDNTAFLTCLANDFGYESVFVRQLRNLMRDNDVVVGISASGNSPNAVRALEYAERNQGIPVAIVGFDGGRMKEVAKHVIHVETVKGDYGPVEDIHMVLDHLISTYLANIPD